MQLEVVVGLLAALLKRAVETGLSEQGMRDLQALSEREYGAAVQEWEAAKSRPAPSSPDASREDSDDHPDGDADRSTD